MGEERVKTKEEEKLESHIKIFSRLGWSFVVLGAGFFIFGLYQHFYTPDLDLNELGSYLGGTVGSLWALAGLFFIYVAFLGQKVEMLYQREELVRRQKDIPCC